MGGCQGEDGNYDERRKDSSCLGTEQTRTLIGCYYFVLLISICINCVVTGKDNMNYLKVICEIR